MGAPRGLAARPRVGAGTGRLGLLDRRPVVRRPNRSTWWRALLIGAVLGIALGAVIATQSADPAGALGYGFGAGLLPAVITSVWAALSRKRWGWGRYVLTVVVLFVVLRLVSLAGALGQIGAFGR